MARKKSETATTKPLTAEVPETQTVYCIEETDSTDRAQTLIINNKKYFTTKTEAQKMLKEIEFGLREDCKYKIIEKVVDK